MISLKELQSAVNVAELLEDNELKKIGAQIIKGYELDDDSRAEWQDSVDKAMDIAKQTMEQKNHPFENASNVKYPLITQAAIDFASRVYPELVQNSRVVNAAVIGNDPRGEKALRAQRVSAHMSYQLLRESDAWEEGLDKLLHILPILGTVFKKTYYDPIKERPISELCDPANIVINYSVKSLEEARRVTHKIQMHTNDVYENIQAKLFSNVDLDKLASAEGAEDEDEEVTLNILEQHCYLDLDGDGYKEPYIVTLHEKSGEILRIYNRFEKVEKTKDGKVKRILPKQYFTDFHFLRSPDGGYYSVGLGTLLYPLNEAINTLINQLIDAGTLNNTQGGFLGRGLRLKNGEFRIKLGEWKVLDAASGTNLSQNIVPLPTKEPSPALFQLLGLLIDVGKDLVAAHDVMQGKGQTQNVSPSTVLAMIQQGMKIFTAISKRLYRSMTKEFQKIYDINKENLTNNEYKRILDDPRADVRIDYDKEGLDILPVADPAMASDAERLVKAQALLQLPTIDPLEATKYYLQTLQFDDATIQQMLPKQQGPNPEQIKAMAEVEKLQAESRATIAKAQVDSEKHLIEVEKLKVMQEDAQTRAQEAAARIMKMRSDMEVNEAKMQIVAMKSDHEAGIKEYSVVTDKVQKDRELDIKEKEGKSRNEDK